MLAYNDEGTQKNKRRDARELLGHDTKWWELNEKNSIYANDTTVEKLFEEAKKIIVDRLRDEWFAVESYFEKSSWVSE